MVHKHTQLALSMRKASHTNQLQPDHAVRRNQNTDKNKKQARKDAMPLILLPCIVLFSWCIMESVA